MSLIPYIDVEQMPEPHRKYAKDFERNHGRLPWLRSKSSPSTPSGAPTYSCAILGMTARAVVGVQWS